MTRFGSDSANRSAFTLANTKRESRTAPPSSSGPTNTPAPNTVRRRWTSPTGQPIVRWTLVQMYVVSRIPSQRANVATRRRISVRDSSVVQFIRKLRVASGAMRVATGRRARSFARCVCVIFENTAEIMKFKKFHMN